MVLQVLCILLGLGLSQSLHLKQSRFLPNAKSTRGLRMSDDCGYRVESKGKVHKLTFDVAGKEMTFETGRIGRQAGGSVLARTMDTMVYTTVCAERESTPVDFTPLRVDFFARYSSVGQTVGAFHRRDSRGDDTEILVARLIDRPIRPMIAEGWQHETQILSWVLSYDKKHSPDALAICSSSAAMMVSEVPMTKPIAGVEIGIVDGVIEVNPTKEQMLNSTLKVTLAGTKEGILMIEGVADFLPEEVVIEALAKGHAAIGVICDAIDAFSKLGGAKPKKTETLRHFPKELLSSMDAEFGDHMQVALDTADKKKRGKACADVEKDIKQRFSVDTPPLALTEDEEKEENDSDSENKGDSSEVAIDDQEGSEVVNEVRKGEDIVSEEDEASELNNSKISKSDATTTDAVNGASGYNYDPVDVKIAIKKLLVRRMRNLILTTGKRSDGRTQEEIRPIDIDTNLLPGAHGSSLFTRGETQSLSTATLGSKGMEQRVETLDAMGTKRFYLQYRFPPSSVGEVGRVGGVNRREVGHGNLAERALMACLPSAADFPYSIRAESLITESCGSSSMATVCACCLAMLDAGVPLSTNVAGIAMGLILGEEEGDEPVILTDILGLEDALGTMDFKVAGDAKGISTFQLDIKCEGLTLEVLDRALQQAKRGRLSILGDMDRALDKPRAMKENIPKILTMQVPPESLGKVIGPKGKTVQTLIETHGLTNINIEDDGTVQIESLSVEKNAEAKEAIDKIVSEVKEGRGGRGNGKDGKEKVELGPPPEDGIVYRDCEIKGVHTFGVFVEMLPGYEGLVHISEIEMNKVNVNDLQNMFKQGDKIDVKFLGKNEKGQMRLSRRAVLMRDAPTPASVSSGAATAAPTPMKPAEPSAAVRATSAAEEAYGS